MTQYEKLLAHILNTGVHQDDRTGVGTRSVFGYQLRYNLQDGFPLVTTKKVSFKNIVHELLWMIKGDTNIKYLVDNGVNIWNDWPLKYYNSCHPRKLSMAEFTAAIKTEGDDFSKVWGELGPVYGAQWRSWGHGEGTADNLGIDQLAFAIRELKQNPASRRIVVNSWNVSQLHNMALPPCHMTFQFGATPLTIGERFDIYCRLGKPDIAYNTAVAKPGVFDLHKIPSHRLNCHLLQRSADAFLGLPYNIASYSLLTHLVARIVNMEVGDFVWSGSDVHIYENHLEQVAQQLMRAPMEPPVLLLSGTQETIDDFKYDNITLIGYQSHPALKGEVAV